MKTGKMTRSQRLMASDNVISMLRSAPPRSSQPPNTAGMRQGHVAFLGADGFVWVTLEIADSYPLSLKCTATVAIDPRDLGAEVTVWQAPGEHGVVLGKRVLPTLSGHALVDGNRRVVIRATDEIVLECGEASITLRRNGRVAIKGVHLETRAKGVNRIKGGTVQIN
jgi:hypothetical protein